MLASRLQKWLDSYSPLSELPPCRRYVVVTLVLRTGVVMKVRIAVNDMDGVRATSLLCLLGLGLGLGSLFLYKICSRFFYTTRPTPPKRRRKVTRHFSDSEDGTPETPSDSGISTYSLSSMGNNVSDATPNISPNSPYTSVLYTSSDGVRFRGIREEAEGQAGNGHDFEMVPHPDLVRKRGKAEGRSNPDNVPLLQRECPDGQKLSSKYSRPLTISIVPETNIASKDKYSMSSPDSDLDLGKTPPERRNSPSAESIGAYSLLPNYSPASLHEKNARLPDEDFNTSTKSGMGTDEVDGWSLVSAPKSIDSPPISPADHTYNSSRMDKDSTNNNFEESSAAIYSAIKHSTPHSKKSRVVTAPTVGLLSDDNVSAVGRILSEEGAEKRKSFVKHSHGSETSSPIELSPQRVRRYNSDSETGSGVLTPDSELFEDGDVGVKTAVSMVELESELTDVQREMEEMYDAISKLTSKENLNSDSSTPTSPNGTRLRRTMQVLRKHKLSPLEHTSSSSRARSISADRDVKDSIPGSMSSPKSSFNQNSSVEYMWDHKSDLATDKSGSLFVAMPPTFSQSENATDDSRQEVSTSPLHSRQKHSLSRKHTDQYSSFDSTGPDSSFKSGTTSISDMYIDDEYSALADSEHSTEGSPSKQTGSDSSSSVSPVRGSISSKSVSPTRDSSKDTSPLKGDVCNSGSSQIQTISPLFPIDEYVTREWRGSTSNADAMRRGYKNIPEKTGLNHLRRVRGDNYCALRATLYQVLVHRLPMAQAIGTLQEVTKRLEVFRDRQFVYLQNWSFGGRLPTASGQVYDQILQCVQCLYQQMGAILNLDTEDAREEYYSTLLNSNEEIDIQLMEAVKVLIMLNALRLHEMSSAGKEVPVFAWLLYARDTSPDPEKFFINHLNCVGDTGGLEQVEMFLLAYTLGVGIQVVRPLAWGHEDYLTCYKEEGEREAPLVHLIAEDDRHYNILLP